LPELNALECNAPKLGLLAGFKLPNGDHTYSHFDRDTWIGTGSTDLLIGAYKIGTFPTSIGKINLTSRERPFSWFTQLQYEYPFMTSGNYTPGKEFDGALGLFYDFGHVGPFNVDNYATHKHPLVKRWLERRPRFHVHFTPTSCSWLNMVERFFRDLTEKQLRRGVFRNVEELLESIGDYIDNHNRQPRPFIWTAKASDILEKVKRAKAALA
jgi:hypothetical protein